MPYKIEKSNFNIVNEIIDLINSGMGESEIKKLLKIGSKPILRISKYNNLLCKLKENNKIYKTKRLKYIAFEKRVKLFNEIKQKYGCLIEEMIKNGCILNDLLNIIPLKNKALIQYLDYFRLNNLRKINSKIRISNLAKINGKLSAKSLKGIELKKITPEIEKRFKELKSELVYKQRVYDAIKKEFNFGDKKIKQLCDRFGYPKDNPQTGELNPMYGKSPGKNSGIGVKSWILKDGFKIFCRSSLELKIYLYLLENNINFLLSKHRIKYVVRNQNKTYNPDIVIDDVIFEIKPEKLINTIINIEKNKAIEKYVIDFGLKYGGYITENTYDLKKYEDLSYILKLIKDGIIIIDNKNYLKLKKYYD